MWEEIYTFFEEYSGVSYDFSSGIQQISGDKLFIAPYEWQTGINTLLEDLQEALDCIEENADKIPDYLPGKIEFKKLISVYLLGGIMENLDYIKRTLNIDPVEISSFEDLEEHLYAVGKLVEMLVTNSLGEITEKKLFSTYITEDDEDDNQFVTLLGLHEKDVFNLYETVSSIRETYEESLDEET